MARNLYKICNKNDYKMCKGCKIYGKIVNLCDDKIEYRRVCMIHQPVLPSKVQCPCIDCLIKGICDNECEEFRNFDSLYRMLGGCHAP